MYKYIYMYIYLYVNGRIKNRSVSSPHTSTLAYAPSLKSNKKARSIESIDIYIDMISNNPLRNLKIAHGIKYSSFLYKS